MGLAVYQNEHSSALVSEQNRGDGGGGLIAWRPGSYRYHTYPEKRLLRESGEIFI